MFLKFLPGIVNEELDRVIKAGSAGCPEARLVKISAYQCRAAKYAALAHQLENDLIGIEFTSCGPAAMATSPAILSTTGRGQRTARTATDSASRVEHKSAFHQAPNVFGLRGCSQDFDGWAELRQAPPNDKAALSRSWRPIRISGIRTIVDDFHGADGRFRLSGDPSRASGTRFSRPLSRPVSTPVTPEDPDMNHPDSIGVGSLPLNNIDGILDEVLR